MPCLEFRRVLFRSEEHTSELQSHSISYAVFCLKKKNTLDASLNDGHRESITHASTDGFAHTHLLGPLEHPRPPCCTTTSSIWLFFFFFNDTATTEIYTFPYTTLFRSRFSSPDSGAMPRLNSLSPCSRDHRPDARSEEHTSELQSHSHLVCRLLLEK